MSQDDDEGIPEFTGVILHYVRQNTYWSSGFDPNNTSPTECSSLDGKKGSLPRNKEGAYGDCKDCKFNQFGSSKQGRGKACRNQIKLYVLLEGKAIPVTFLISPSNLQAFSGSYLMDQVNQRNLAYWKVLTKFSAYKKPKEQFGRIKWEVAGEFKDEELDKIRQVRDFWLPIITNDTRTIGDVGGEGESESSSHEAAPSTTENRVNATPAPAGKTITPKKVEPASNGDDEDVPF
jgi:hypothetical protein